MVRDIFLILCTVMVVSACLKIDTADRSIETDGQDTTATVDYTIEEFAAISLLERKLFPPELPSRVKSKREAQLGEALENFNANPDSLDNIIWFGRRLAYLFLYKEAIKVYTDGLQKFPESYELYRHRGHRFLTIRDFDSAISDLQNAAFYMRNEPIKMESNGSYFGRNIPRISVQFNVWYHLGLAYYLKGNYDKAVSAYKQCLELANNDDMLVSATDWLYMTYRRLGNAEAAEELLTPIRSRMNVIENKAYHKKLLMYKGQIRREELFDIQRTDLSLDQMTYAYGIANWYFFNGQSEVAFQIFNKMMESDYWPAFGYLAAEVELANLRRIGAS